MKPLNLKLKTSLPKIIDHCFTTLIFVIAFISFPFVLNPNKTGKELFMVAVVFLWLLFKSAFFFTGKTFKLYTCDVVMALSALYISAHYWLCSFFSFGYSYFWVLISCIVLFYLFRSAFGADREPDAFFRFGVQLVWACCFMESAIALLQKLEYAKMQNEYFDMAGTFINPNFLGVYMAIGLIATLYMLLFFQLKRSFSAFIVAGGLLMLLVLYWTYSRASWIALVIALLFLGLSSPKNISFLKAHKKKTLVFSLLAILLCSVFVYFLYQLNKDSADGRGVIRKIAVSDIKENPVFGNGIFNFASVYNSSKAAYFNGETHLWDEVKVANYVSVSFNDYLQIIFETGFIGLALLSLLFYTLVRGVQFSPQTRLGLSLALAFCVLGMFTSVLYNPTAMVFLMWGLSVVFAYGANRKEAAAVASVFAIRCASLSAVFISAAILVFFYFKTQALADFKDIVQKDGQRLYYKFSDARMLLIADEPYAEFKFGFEKYHEGEQKEGLWMMNQSVKKAPVPDANLALAGIYMTRKEFLHAEELLLLNAGIEPFRFEPLDNLLQFYIEIGQKDKIRKTAEKIIKLPVKIESNKVQAYKERANKILKEYKQAN